MFILVLDFPFSIELIVRVLVSTSSPTCSCVRFILSRAFFTALASEREKACIQNDVGNRHSPTTIVAAISTQIKTKANLPTHYHLKPGSGLVQPSMVMLEQIRTVDKTRLVQYLSLIHI